LSFRMAWWRRTQLPETETHNDDWCYWVRDLNC
jgi:hypothetical protein